MKKIIFVGSVLPEDDLKTYKGPSVAGNKMQLGFIDALSKRSDVSLDVLTQRPISFFPSEKKLWIPRQKTTLFDRINMHHIPFINLPIIKNMMMMHQTLKALRRWLKVHEHDECIIVTFNAMYQISEPIYRLRNRKNVKSVCILADPPLAHKRRSRILSWFKNIEYAPFHRNIQYYHGIVALNSKIVSDFAPKVPHIIIEGGLNPDGIPPIEYPKDHHIIHFVYSGALTEYSGVRTLIQAIDFLHSSKIHVDIYGDGPLKEEVIQASKTFPQLNYGGVLANKDMMSVQAAAHFLINPRIINDPMTTYTFPSKLVEYLASGTPTITTRINGLSERMLTMLYTFESDQPEAIAHGIISLTKMNYSDIKEKAIQYRNDVIKEMNWQKQTDKMMHFIQSL